MEQRNGVRSFDASSSGSFVRPSVITVLLLNAVASSGTLFGVKLLFRLIYSYVQTSLHFGPDGSCFKAADTGPAESV